MPRPPLYLLAALALTLAACGNAGPATVTVSQAEPVATETPAESATPAPSPTPNRLVPQMSASQLVDPNTIQTATPPSEPTAPLVPITPPITPIVLPAIIDGTPQANPYDTPPPTAQASATIKPTITPKPTDLPGPTMAGPARFVIRNGVPAYMANFANNLGCNWLAVTGSVIGPGGSPVPGMKLRLINQKSGGSQATRSGDAPVYGASGYEFVLGDRPIEGDFILQLLADDESPLSDPILIHTRAVCAENQIVAVFMPVGTVP